MRELAGQGLHDNQQNIDIASFSEMKKLAYDIVHSHLDTSSVNINQHLLALMINGVAGTGKSYLINAIRVLLGEKCTVTATRGRLLLI